MSTVWCDHFDRASVANMAEGEVQQQLSEDASDCPPVPAVKYEYLDHTADVQLHAWGDDLQEAFEQVGMSMFGYMTEIDKVDIRYTYYIEADGDDMMSLLYHYLDEWLFAFCAEPFFIPRVIKIVSFDRENFKIQARGWGETFDLSKHPQGADVKAITYSNMQIHDDAATHDVYVIIDI